MSQDDLVRQINNRVTKNAISKYEKGEMMADSAVLLVLAKALGVKTDYFFQPFTVDIDQIAFRKKKSLAKKDLGAIRQKIADHVERYVELEQFLNIDNRFINPLEDFKVKTYADVELAANELLNSWELGFNALPGVIDMLETHGIKVFEMEAPDAFDGLSGYANRYIPIIVVNRNYAVERKRLTVLHELGHLVLNFDSSFSEKEVEKLCFRFGEALLIPEATFKKELGQHRNHISMPELIVVKEAYGLSIQAIMARARDLGVISEPRYRQFCISIAKNKREDGLGTYPGKEQASRFRRLLFRAAAEELISISKAANLANQKLAEFRQEFVGRIAPPFTRHVKRAVASSQVTIP